MGAEEPMSGVESASNIVSKMSLAQKARLVVGESFWRTCPVEALGGRGLLMSDGPHGIRRQPQGSDNLGINESVPATCFPTASLVACSFDPGLVRLMGRALGEEARKEGVAVLLGPGVNVKRHPLCGRNFEYYSEDPLLSGELGAAWVAGVQSCGVGASLKHFACNNQELSRMVSDSVVDERALNEVYLLPFEIAVRKGRPWTVMAAYNKVNGVHAAENPVLLEEKLRGSWGFDGAVVTDWGAACRPLASVRAGLDLVMPGPNEGFSAALEQGVERGELAQADLDRSAGHVVSLALRHREAQTVPFSCHMGEHLALAKQLAVESAVLLENDGTLPLSPAGSIAVIGAFAKAPRYQGGGSSKINPTSLDSAWDALWEAGCEVGFAVGYERETGQTTEELLVQAEELAAARDAAVVFVGLPDSFESEGYDRAHMRLPEGHVALIDRVCAANPRTVVVLQSGSPVEAPWRHEPAALLWMGLAGCRGGAAVVDLLLGAAVPCGKLAETWPLRLSDTALGDGFPERAREVLYRESVYVGYRYYDTAGVDVAYPFGYGLSYSRFEYADLRVRVERDGYEVQVAVRNLGSVRGAETVQFYLHAEDAPVFVPEQWLVGFDKLELACGETRIARAHLGFRAFAHWDAAISRWRADEGAYELRAAASSRDVRLATRIVLACSADGAACEPAPFEVSPRPRSDRPAGARPGCYHDVVPHGFTDAEFAVLFGRELPKAAPVRPFTPDSLFSDLRHSLRGRAALKLMLHEAGKTVNMGDPKMRELVSRMIDEMPLRALSMAGIAREHIEGLLRFLNTGHGGSAGRHVRGDKR